MSSPTLTIGQIAAQAGVNTSAIRFYERTGVLPEAERVGGQRRYDQTALTRLGVIEVAKRAGFSLDEVRVLLASTDAGTPAHEQLRLLAEQKLPEVDALIERAQAVRRWLVEAARCDCQTLDVCALFEEASA